MLQPRKRKTPPPTLGTSAAPPDDLDTRTDDDEDDPLPTIDSLMEEAGLTVADQPAVINTDAPKSGRVARARSESIRQASEAVSQPAKKQQIAARSSSTAKSGSAPNPYSTRTAAQRRAERETRRSAITPRTGASQPPRKAKPRPTSGASAALVRELLLNPTRTVSEDELRQVYGYVLADVRNMALLAFALVIVLVVLAQVLPR